MTKDRSVMNLGWLSLFILFFMMASAFSTYAAAPAGFSQYYIPGPEEQMLELFESIGSGSQGTTMHSIITVTVWSDNTVIYYDHWENGYGFDPDNPATTADETYFNVTPSSRGDSQTFESANIPSSPRLDTATFYDGMDRIYVAGGPATVTRASWPEADGTLFSVAWEVYPIRPQLVKYILPFGEELATAQYDTTFRDEFSTVSYSNNDGDNNWAGDWIEEGEVSPDTNGDPTGGRISITGNQLRLYGQSSNPTDPSAARELDLSSYTSASLSFDWSIPFDDIDTSDSVVVEVSSNGGASYTVLDTFTGYDVAASGSESYDISAYISSNTRIRFRVNAFYGAGLNEFFDVDNVQVGVPSSPPILMDFERVLALAQATDDNTTITVDFDGDGTLDTFDTDQDGDIDGSDTTSLTLNKGESFLLNSDAGTMVTTGTTIEGTSTLQMQYVIGDQDSNFEIRGLSAFPRGFWDDEYYAPVPSASDTADPTDIYLHNPHDTILTIDYETTTGSGTFTIDPKETRSFEEATGSYAPQSSAVYFKGSDVFWGISTIDTSGDDPLADEGRTHDWGYSLVPAFLLANEHFMGWAPGAEPVGGNLDDSGIYISPAADNITIFVDFDNDGAADQTYNLDRLQTQYIFDPNDGDMSEANVWATGPYTIAYGQNPDTSATAVPAIDVGYTTIPGGGFIEKALIVEKGVSPAVLSTTPGSVATYTVKVETFDFDMDNIIVTDTLPADFEYVIGTDTTSISLADKTTATDDPAITGSGTTADPYVLTWGSAILGSMDENQEITVTFTVRTTTGSSYNAGDLTRNDVEVEGERIVGTVTQTLVTTDFVYNSFAAASDIPVVEKSTSGIDPLNPGDTYTYTVEVHNPNGASADLTGIAIYDPLPDGIDYVSSSSVVKESTIRVNEYFISAGDFTGTTYDLTLNQVLKTDYFVIIQGSGGSGGTTTGPNQNYAALTADPFGTGNLGSSGSSDVITLSRGNGTTNWVGVVTVVESLGDTGNSSFSLLDVQRVDHTGTATTGSDTSGTAWTDINQVMLMGGYNGAGCDTTQGTSSRSKVCHVRITPSGSDQIDWTRNATGATMDTATSTVMVVEWGSEWTVQRVRVQGGNGGGGADAVGEYNTSAITTVDREDTWVWGTGHTNDQGIGDAGEGVLITLGDGVNQNTTESSVAVGLEYAGNAVDFEVYAITHTDLKADYQFKTDGDSGASTYDVSVDTAKRNRMALSYNGQNGTGNAYPRPMFSARYADDGTIRLERRRTGQEFPAWVQGIDFSQIGVELVNPAGDAPNFVSSGDGYSVEAGQTLILTFDVTVDDPLATGITEIENTAYITTDQFSLPLTDDATNTVVNPSTDSAEVGNRVWFDINGDGVDDVGEPGLSNVEVTLKDDFGTPIAVTTTDGNGNYLFTGVTPGIDYYVEVTDGLPAGLVQSSPTGHTDDQTDPFDLTAGQSYLDADLGYTGDSGTATIGDFVWSDADGDGAQDAGEPGISGVTVQIYLDDDGTAGLNTGTDTLVGTTTTAADGSYLFTGVTASGTEDYFVYVNDGQAALSGYTVTTPTGSTPSASISVQDVDPGEIVLNADFGFQPNPGTTFSISDKVWFDADADGTLDGGEPGISGVTVDLLDATGSVIATTTTDANGNFTFSGLPGGGADYTIKITDTGGALNDYYGTTAPAIATELDIDNLTADVNNTGPPNGAPNFGYSLSGSMGDTVFNDLDGDGTQDTGEMGFGGLTVNLYIDTNGNGLLDDGGSAVASQVTDANGNYLFAGLDDGNYIVSIDSPPTGFTYTGTDSDTGTAGDQQAGTISGGNNILDRDFGYQAAIQREISGTIWNDPNEDGSIGGSEGFLAGVTIELVLDATGETVATATTDVNGDYIFQGISPADYTVRVTDDLGVLSGYYNTYEKTEGARLDICGGIPEPDPSPGPPCTGDDYNNEEAITNTELNNGNVTLVDFGYKNLSVTAVVLSQFKAYHANGKVVVEWETVSERGTLGFYLKRKSGKHGKFKRVNKKLMPGLLFSPKGGTYRLVDKKAKPGGTYTYLLVELEARGKRNHYGPFTVTVGKPGIDFSVTPMTSEYSKIKRKRSKVEKLRSLAAKLSKKKARRLKRDRKGPKAKMSVTADDIYYLDAGRIAEVLGVSLNKAVRWIKRHQLNLKNRGKLVAWMPDDGYEGIFFYGEGIDSIYTDENVYWVEKRRGLRMQRANGVGPDPVLEEQTFTETIHYEQDIQPANAFFDDPQDDYFLWGAVLFLGFSPPGGVDPSIMHLPFKVEDAAPVSGKAILTIRLKGLNSVDMGDMGGFGLPPEIDTSSHVVAVSVNGNYIDTVAWTGFDGRDFSLELDHTLLVDGDNLLTIQSVFDPTNPARISFVGIDSFDLSYQRHYHAMNDRLIFTGGTHEVITVGGFIDADIYLFDVTNPRQPVNIKGVTIDTGDDGVYRISFTQPDINGKYVAATWRAISTMESVVADAPSDLKRWKTRGEYVVITPASLKNAAQALADYRSEYATKVVELENIYDEFNHGIANPEAIQAFLAYAHNRWRQGPRYVVLAGEGTYDHKNVLGIGDSLMPTMIVNTPDGLFPSDNWFGDVEGYDGIPEIAIGRLPAVTEAELTAMIDKIRVFEAGGDWKNRVMMVADDADGAGNFPEDSDKVAELVPTDNTLTVHLDPSSAATIASARADLLAGINSGVGLVNYIGHGGPDRLADEGLLQKSDLDTGAPLGLTNSQKPTIFTAMTCIVGQFADPGFDYLSEELMLHNNGGAVAIWSPSGESLNPYAKVLDEAFFRAVFAEGETVLGDAILKALKQYSETELDAYMQDIFILLGDPALRMR